MSLNEWLTLLEAMEKGLHHSTLTGFYWVRQLRDIEKKPSTSELVDWLRALVAGGVDPDRIQKEIPFAGVLLKKTEDLEKVKKPAGESRGW